MRQQQLLVMTVTDRALGLLFGLGQCGQEHRGENRDNGYDHEQFDQSKAVNRLRREEKS